MAADMPASVPPEAEPESSPSPRPVRAPSEQMLAEFHELYQDDSPEDEEPSSEERNVSLKDFVLRPKCSRCVIFRDNCIGYLNALSDLSPRIGELEALRPEIKMLKKLNADLTTQLEDSIRSEQTLKARVTAGDEENAKVKEQLESLEKDYYSLAKAAEEGKKHAHEASVWRVKYEKTLDICEKLQDKRKRETANFEKLLNLAEGYKKELDATKAKFQEEKAQHVVWASASKRYVPRLYALVKTIMSDSNVVAQLSSKTQAEAAKLCAPEVKKALRVPVVDEEEDEESVLLERLLNAESTSEKGPQLDEPSGSDFDTSAKKVESLLHKPISDIPAPVPSATDLLLSELNDEEADELLAAGAEALNSIPSKSPAKRGGGSARGRGRGARKGRGPKQTPAFAASFDHDSIDRRYDEMLQSKLKRGGTNEASDLGSGGLKHMSIHGKKTMTVREQQQAQMKVSIKEKVAMMKNLEKAKENVSETLDGGEGSSKDINVAKTVDGDTQNEETTSPTKSSYSVRNDLVMSASPSPASSIAAEPIVEARDEAADKGVDAHEFLALEEFGTLEQGDTPSNAEVENENAAAMEMEVVPTSGDTHGETMEPLTGTSELSEEVVSEPPVEKIVDERFMEEQSSEIHPQAVIDEDAVSTEHQQRIEEPHMADVVLEMPNTENKEGGKLLDLAAENLEVAHVMEESATPEDEEGMGEISKEVGATGLDTAELTRETATVVEFTFEGRAAKESREATGKSPVVGTSVEITVNIEEHQHTENEPQEETADEGEVTVAEGTEAPMVAESVVPSDEVASTEEEAAMSVLVKPPKPHLAKDTKRALGLMRRLEVDLKDVVEPIPDAEIAKKRLSTDGPSSDLAKPADITESQADALESSTTDAAHNEVDEERDREEAMKLHAALNLPSLRARKDLEHRSRDGIKEGAPKPDATARMTGRKRSINAQPITDSPQPESSLRNEDKAKQKEPSTVEQADMNDIVGSILAGAHTATVAPSGVTPVPSLPDPNVLENSSYGVPKPKSSISNAAEIGPQPSLKTFDSTPKLTDSRKSRVKTTQRPPSAEHAPARLAAAFDGQTASVNPAVTVNTQAATQSVDDKPRIKRGRGRPKRQHPHSVMLTSAKSAMETAEEAKIQRRSAVSPSSSSAYVTNEEAVASVQNSSEVTSSAVAEPSNLRDEAVHLRDEAVLKTSTLPTVSKNAENVVEQAASKEEAGSMQATHDTRKKGSVAHDADNAAPAASGPSEAHKEAPSSAVGISRKRQPEPPLKSILPKRTKLTHLQPTSESSPALHTRRRGSAASPLELDFSIPTRTRTRTGPVAPKRRKPVEESKAEPTQQKGSLSEASTDDEDRLCIAEHNEGEAQPPPVQASEPGKETVFGLEEEADDEERLVIANEEDEERAADAVEKAAGDLTTAPEVTAEKVASEDRGDEGAVSQPSLALHATRSSKRITSKDVSSSTNESARNLDTTTEKTPRARSGVLQAVRRSLAKPGSGPATMHRLSSRIAKQLQQSGSGIVTRTSAVRKRSSIRTPRGHPEITKPLPAPVSVSTKINLRSSGPADNEPSTIQRESLVGRKVPARGLKRRVEESTETVSSPKKAAAVENTLQKKLHGVLTSEQKIEVIRNTLGEDVDAIAKMDPDEFASTMMKCSLNLQSGDVWTLVQTFYSMSEFSYIPNRKEDMLINIANELAGGPQIWVPYVKKLLVTISTQAINAVNTTRYVRLLCWALNHAGDLLSVDEKKNYLRAALVRIFLNDVTVAIKATTNVLLSPAAEWLDWMNDKNDPFFVILSLALSSRQAEGKILLWAWFQQFSQELQVLDVSPASLRKTFDELLERLDKLAASRGESRADDIANTLPTEEEIALMNIATSFFPPGSGTTVVAKTVVGEILKDCVSRIRTALNPRTIDGDREWPKALMVDCRLRICINLAMKAILCKDATLSREFCALLQSDISSVRDLRDDVEKSVEERPWMRVYHDVINDILGLMQTLTSYEL
ncbi:unnamed protein product [Cylicocyclus nassatus]|uniref:Uncharacterized protein n=1 Tax=Cylicocyclus nassatus TaxID=53992 RepID=A0AA36H1N9_CYLNA|nr:unnamed protein product [Cylicocyclus nassatus]